MTRDIAVVIKMPNSEEWQFDLEQDLKEAGIPLSRVRFLSVLPERTFDAVSNKAIKDIASDVRSELAELDPSFILLLGNEPLLAILGKSGINNHRGRVYSYRPKANSDSMVIATSSPAVAKRNPRQRPGYIADMRLLSNLIYGRTSLISQPKYSIIDTKEKLKKLKQILKRVRAIGFDVETHDEYYKPDGRIVSFAATCIMNDGKWFNFVIPLYHPESVWKRKHRSVLTYLKDELEAITNVTAHNGGYDAKWMIQYGINLIPTFDTMLCQALLNENSLKGLKPMAQARLGVAPWGIDTKNLLSTPIVDILPYNVCDTYYMMKCKMQMLEELKEEPRQARILKYLLMPALAELIRSEVRGIWIDVNRLTERMPIAIQTLADIESQIMAAGDISSDPTDVGRSCNPSSPEWPTDAKGKPREVNFNASLFARWFLFDWCGLPVLERGKEKDDGRPGDPSMAEGVLMALKNDHKVIPHMLDRVKWQKYISSFLNPYSELYDEDHRIHTNFKLAGTVTGRLSSGKTDDDKITGVRGKVRGVNLQQVPRDPFIRGLFGAPYGWYFVQSDFSQVELRIAAFLAREMTMIRLYQQGADIHLATAARVTGLPENQVTKEIRKKVGKPVNFGFLYGMGALKFIDTAFTNYGSKFSLTEAKAARKAYFDLYPGLLPWHAKCRRLVNTYGRVQSPLGRVRNLPDIYSPDQTVRAEAERQAINSPVQGFASDLAVLSMIEINRKFREIDLPAHCLGLVHDAINYEIREDAMPVALPIIKDTMEDMSLVERKFNVHIDIPIIADISAGRHWGDLIELNYDQVHNFSVADIKLG